MNMNHEENFYKFQICNAFLKDRNELTL